MRALATKPLADPSLRCARRGGALSARCTRARRRSPSSITRWTRPRHWRVPRRRRSSTRCCAATCASATRWTRPCAARPGRALVASALVDRARAARITRRTGRTILAAGNARPPLTLARQPPRRRRATRCSRASPPRGIDATPAGDAGIIVDPPRPVRALPGFAEGAFSVQDLGAQLAAPLSRSTDGHARARRLRGARRQDDAPARACRRRAHRARQRRRAACHAFARTSLRLGSTDRDVQRRRRRRRRAGGVVGRPAVRPHPRRRAVHGVGRRAPASRRQVAAPRKPTSQRFARAADAAPRRAVAAASRPAGCCCTRRARCSRRKTRRRSRRSSRATPMRCAKPSPFRAEVGAARRRNSCLRCPARATIKTDSSTRCSARPEGHRSGADSARPDADRPSAPCSTPRPPACPQRFDPLRPRDSAATLSAWIAAVLRAAGARLRRAVRGGARRHDRRQVGGAAGRRRRCTAQRRVRPRVQSDARGGAPEGHAALLRARVRAHAPRWYWLDEKVLRSCRSQYRVSYNALTRQYRVAQRPSRADVRLAGGSRALHRPRHVAAGRTASTSSSRARATTRRCACGSTSTSCRSRSR